MKNILDLNSIEARKYFLDSSSYTTLDLPPYYDFSNLLNAINSDFSDEGGFEEFQKTIKTKGSKDKKENPSWIEKVNHNVLIGKGDYNEWRKITLIHPILYVSLIRKITKKNNWAKIKRLLKNQPEHINSIAIPVLNKNNLTDKFVSINNWKNNFERKSIQLANSYDLLYETDIANCYGSIYTHSIPWAIEGKVKAKKNRRDKEALGNSIDYHLSSMNYGQTNGIPQGSTAMDLIAEIVLAYIDKEVAKRLKGVNYKILRFRDDIRIFVNSQDDGKNILKVLSEELINVGMSLNKSKTKEGVDIILNSVKEDRMKLLQVGYRELPIEDLLLFTYSFLNKNRNSGRIFDLLNAFSAKFPYELKNLDTLPYCITILTQIAYENRKYFTFVTQKISETINSLGTDELKKESINVIVKKFENSNSNFEKIWLKRLGLVLLKNLEFDEKLCHLSEKKMVGNLWNFSWVKTDYKNKVSKISIINKKALKKIGAVISEDEIDFNVGY